MATQNKSQESRYSQYKANKTWEKNRMKRLLRAQKKQPNNKQIENALKGGFVYRRKTPTTTVWSSSWRRIAQIFKLFEGRFDPKLMSSNEKVAAEAMKQQSITSRELLREKNRVVQDTKDMFSIATRIGAK